MSYIVASATKPDYKFETYEEAWEWAQFMRRNGIIAAIVTSDDPWKYWSVWKAGTTRHHVVSARSADEALVVARGITHDDSLNIVQRH